MTMIPCKACNSLVMLSLLGLQKAVVCIATALKSRHRGGYSEGLVVVCW